MFDSSQKIGISLLLLFVLVAITKLVTADPLFQVTDDNGNTIFSVHPDGIRVTNSTGHAIMTAADTTIHFNVGQSAGLRAASRSFAIGSTGSTLRASSNEDIFILSPDSIRFYVGQPGGLRAASRSFAIGSTGSTLRSSVEDYFTLSPANSVSGTLSNEQRMLWYPEKEAFWVGNLDAETASIGFNSMVSGYHSKAYGNYSQAFGYEAQAGTANADSFATAIGYQANATGKASFAFGSSASATALNSFAFGEDATASGDGSYAFGSVSRDTLGNLTNEPTEARGDYSFAIGLGAKATTLGAMAFGASNTANGQWSLAMGRESTTGGKYSIAMGYQSRTGTFTEETAIGRNCFANNRAATAIGYNSTASGSGSVAIGNTAVASNNYTFATSGATASGYNALALGDGATSSGGNAIAIGSGTVSGDEGTVALGYNAEANYVGAVALGNGCKGNLQYATAVGYQSEASSVGTLAMGYKNKARNAYATAMGHQTVANGYAATSLGYETQAQPYASFVIGRYNVVSGDSSSWQETDPLFVVGNGESTASPSNAMTILKNGFVGIHTDSAEVDLHIKQSQDQPPGSPFIPGTGGLMFETASTKWQLRASGNSFYYHLDGTWRAFVSGSNGNWNTVSDRRLKKDIEDMEDVLVKLKQLKPVKYRFRDAEEGTPQTRGFIAQDVEEIFPDVVHKDAARNYYGLAYDNFAVLAIKAIQEQQAIIEQQTSELDELSSEIEEIKELLKAIKQPK